MEQRGREDFWIGRSVLVTGAYGFLAGSAVHYLGRWFARRSEQGSPPPQ